MCPNGDLETALRPNATQLYQVLLDTADLVARDGILPELFQELAERLGEVVSFDNLNFALHEPKANAMQVHIVQSGHRMQPPLLYPVSECASGWVWETQQSLVVADVSRETRYSAAINWLSKHGMRSFCVLPLSTVQRRLGALGFASSRLAAYREKELEFLQRITELTALAVDNALVRQALNQEKECWQVLAEVNGALISNLNVNELFPRISSCLAKLIPHDFAGLSLYDKQQQCIRPYLLAAVDKEVVGPGNPIPLQNSLTARTMLEGKIRTYGLEDVTPAVAASEMVQRLLAAGIQSALVVPLITANGPVGTLNLGRKQQHGFACVDRDLLSQVGGQIAIALENSRVYQDIDALKNKLAEEKSYLEGEIRTELNFEEIVGESVLLKRALREAKTVAPSDATALILGETGTGKELIARAIHNLSGRRDKSFIKMNCAAIPTALLESELFGHEKGAFTGAISQKIGRLELADKGTLFLDEVGDIPLEIQPKLLRVLQDHEFERLGSTRTIKVDVRLIAATNQDLGKLAGQRQFRSDLYYRLNVFPISLPPLRERRGDIPLLVRYFVQRLALRMNKTIESIPAEAMNALSNWNWPGNVRELENLIERSIILSNGPVLRVPLSELRLSGDASPRKDLTLQSAEREHIVRVLRDSAGVISGPRGAATRLGLKRTTLQSKMQKLGISRNDYLC